MLTEKQKAEKRAKLKAFQSKIKSMTDDELQEIVKAHGAIVTIEGHSLSFKNSLMCIWQHSEVSVVGGFQQWKRAGRVVKKGERGIAIYIPCNRKKDDESNSDDIYFSTSTVFDISQTQELEGGAQ